MQKIQIQTSLNIYNGIEDLPLNVKELMKVAIEARNQAYAPYSHFKVGAAILLKNGEIVIGSNQENAAYPSGLCAERVAVFQAGAKFPKIDIEMIAITAASELHLTTTPIPPCGACRQSLIEYEMNQENQIPIFFMGEQGQVYQSESIKNLLPFVFDKHSL